MYKIREKTNNSKRIDTLIIYSILIFLLSTTLAYSKEENTLSASDGFYSKLMSNEVILATTEAIPLLYDDYVVVEGDNTSFIAQNTGASLDTIISVNKITNAHLIQPGKVLKIPNRNGLLYTVKINENAESIAEKYEMPVETILRLNDIENSSNTIAEGTDLFLSGARYTLEERIEMYGLSFFTPLYAYRLSSYFGYRSDPFTGARKLHSGIDFAAPAGTSVMAARGGTVSFVGYSGGYGLLIIIKHDEEYTSYYAHLSSARVSVGQKVGMGSTIGGVGSTGRSTGNHLHFEIRRFGTPVDPKWYVSLAK